MRVILTWSNKFLWFIFFLIPYPATFSMAGPFFSIFVPLRQGLRLRFSTNDVEWKKSLINNSPWSSLPSKFLVFHLSRMACDRSHLRGPCHLSLSSSSPSGPLSQLSNCVLLTTHNTHFFLPTTLTYLLLWFKKSGSSRTLGYKQMANQEGLWFSVLWTQ